MDSLEELKQKIQKFVDERDWNQYHTPSNLAKSISIEASELLECFQRGEEYKIEDVKDELADVLIYCQDLLVRLNLDEDEI
ncbi:MAG: nucleotide pyrophosphohydrolase, partial [Bacilli bacterium]|nr:nucleotide pyrophosphohydrolase [Bacilli bacterium]